MALPTEFPEQNTVWKGYPAEGMPGEEVVDLPAYRSDLAEQRNRGPICSISCWKLTAEELAEIQEQGVVWLHVWGVHPPVRVDGHNPFAQRMQGVPSVQASR